MQQHKNTSLIKIEGINWDLPIICTTDYKAASTIKLDIKDGGNLICGVISVAKHGLHPLEFEELGQLDLSA